MKSNVDIVAQVSRLKSINITVGAVMHNVNAMQMPRKPNKSYESYKGDVFLKTTVVNKYHKVPYDIYIGRGSKWGNPFSHLDSALAQFRVKTREEAIEKYGEWIMTQPKLLADLHELKGKTLCCYCKPQICHGDILVELVSKLDS